LEDEKVSKGRDIDQGDTFSNRPSTHQVMRNLRKRISTTTSQLAAIYQAFQNKTTPWPWSEFLEIFFEAKIEA
jgi:hypothetical protein